MAKHLLLIAAVGVSLLTACTSEEVVDDVATSRNLIRFENVVNKSTRADEITTKNLSKFNVFGFYTMPENTGVANEVFDNVPVVYNTEGDNQGRWTYDNVYQRHWVPGGKYYFYAYSCGNTSKLATGFGSFKLDMDNTTPKPVTERTLEISKYICDDTHQHDLIFASNTGGADFAGITGLASGNSPVAFQFKHILTKLKARFTTTFPKEYQVRISDVSMRNIRNTGDYNFKDGWTNVGGNIGVEPFVVLTTKETIQKDNETITNNYITISNEKTGDVQKSVDTETAFTIPYDYYTANGGKDATTKEVYIRFTVDVYYENEKAMSKILIGRLNPKWDAGYSYVYNIEINGTTTNMEVISFTTVQDGDGALVGWDSDESPVITIN